MSGEQLSNVKYEEEFILSSSGVKLFTCRWVPTDRDAKALIFLCHGYGMECSIFMEDTGVRLAKAGYAVFGIDYQGHGKSTGTRCYIQSFDDLVIDCATFFRVISERIEYRKKARFLYGESMGGAVALLIHRKQPNYWSGAVFVAPMCKITENLKPHPLVISILKKLTAIIPTWKLVPTEDIVDISFKEPEKRLKIRANPYVYRDRPRLKTAYELLTISLDIEKRLDEVSLPFLIVHGEADKVTDPSVSKLLYASAKSVDKTLKLYPDMWHGLTYGEPAGHIELVFSDIVAWLGIRSGVGCPEDSQLERNAESGMMKETASESERKLANDSLSLAIK